ncbi:hypothetical protein FB446DRAFT_706526 [Lentinula raphanica]|nr:hypothetical protein FB446DRAFT_706526 [Lentinula raphanica]
MRLNTSSVLRALVCLSAVLHIACGPPSTATSPPPLTATVHFHAECSNLQIDGVQHDPMNTKATLLRNFAVEGFKHSETVLFHRYFLLLPNIHFQWVMDQSRSGAGVTPVPETVEDLGDGRQKLMFRIKFLFLGFENHHPKRFSGLAYVEFVHDPHDPYKALDRSEANMEISLEKYNGHRVRSIPVIEIGPQYHRCNYRFSNPEPDDPNSRADLYAVGKVVEIDAEGNKRSDRIMEAWFQGGKEGEGGESREREEEVLALEFVGRITAYIFAPLKRPDGRHDPFTLSDWSNPGVSRKRQGKASENKERRNEQKNANSNMVMEQPEVYPFDTRQVTTTNSILQLPLGPYRGPLTKRARHQRSGYSDKPVDPPPYLIPFLDQLHLPRLDYLLASNVENACSSPTSSAESSSTLGTPEEVEKAEAAKFKILENQSVIGVVNEIDLSTNDGVVVQCVFLQL